VLEVSSELMLKGERELLSRVIRGQRKGAGSIFRAHVKRRKGAAKSSH